MRTSFVLELLSHVLRASLGKIPDDGQSTSYTTECKIDLLVPRSTNVETAGEARGSFGSTDTVTGIVQAQTRESETGDVSTDTRAAIGSRSVTKGEVFFLLVGHLSNESLGLGVSLGPVPETRALCWRCVSGTYSLISLSLDTYMVRHMGFLHRRSSARGWRALR